MSHLDDYYKKLNRLNKSIAEAINNITDSASAAEAESDLQSFATTLELYTMDISEGGVGVSSEDRRAHRKNHKQHRKNKANLETMLENKRNELDRGDLMSGASANDKPENGTEDAMLSYCVNKEKDTTKTTENIQRTVEKAKALGREKLTQLEEQNAAFEKIMDDLVGMEKDIETGTEALKRMRRKVASDRCMWPIIFLVLLGIVTVLGLAIFKGDNEDLNAANDAANSLI